jgi:hypothetical protein
MLVHYIGCLSGPIDASDDDEDPVSTRFSPFDKYLEDPDLDLFNEEFVNELIHQRQPNRFIFELRPDGQGNVRRQFKKQGPRRLRDELRSTILP